MNVHGPLLHVKILPAVSAMLTERYGIDLVTLQPEAGTAILRRLSLDRDQAERRSPA